MKFIEKDHFITVSDLIKALENIKNEYGDLPLADLDSYGRNQLNGLLSYSNKDKETLYTIGGKSVKHDFITIHI